MPATAKQLYPDKPVVLGGWHPSLLPHQTLAADYIDIVVKGQGEEAFLEIVQRIEAGESMEGVAGAGYKEDGRIVFNAAARSEADSRDAAEGLSSGGFRRLRASVRTPLGHVHFQSRLPLRLRLLHQ